MPLVTIYRRASVTPRALAFLKSSIAMCAAFELSTREIELSEKSFSFVCPPPQPEDDLKYDAIVVIPAHNFEERLERGEDFMSRRIKKVVIDHFHESGHAAELPDLQVMVQLAPLGWSGDL